MAKIIKSIYQFKRGTAQRWIEVNPVLLQGEPGFEYDTGKLKIGDGSTTWLGLPYINDVEELSKAFKFKGTAGSISEDESTIYDADGTAIEDISIGDVYQIGEKEYAYNGEVWVELGFNVDLTEYVKHIDINQTYDPDSENAQSGKAVAEALSGYVVAEVGKGLSSNDFTNEDKEKLNSALQNENIDQTYSPTSANAQSGKAVEEAINAFFSDNNMEFIKEITLTEDVGMIDILTKDEGVELRDTFIYCSFLCTEVGSKYISLRKDGGNSYYGYGLNIGNYTENHITNGRPHVFGHFIYPIGETGRVLTLGLEGTVDGNVDLATGVSQGLMMHSSTFSYTYSSSSQKIDNLNMLLVKSTETNLIKAGSKIWLFGRRVK